MSGDMKHELRILAEQSLEEMKPINKRLAEDARRYLSMTDDEKQAYRMKLESEQASIRAEYQDAKGAGVEQVDKVKRDEIEEFFAMARGKR